MPEKPTSHSKATVPAHAGVPRRTKKITQALVFYIAALASPWLVGILGSTSELVFVVMIVLFAFSSLVLARSLADSEARVMQLTMVFMVSGFLLYMTVLFAGCVLNTVRRIEASAKAKTEAGARTKSP